MKKNIAFLGLLTVATLCLTACGNSKDYTMSFEDALEAANHSALEDILTNTENFQQSFDVSTNLDRDWSKIIANLQANSNQNLSNTRSEFNTNFDVNISSEEWSLGITGALDIKSVDDVIYLNLKSLWISWSEDVSLLSAMVDWFKNQWYFISMTWLTEVPSSISHVKDAKELNSKAKEMFINEWSVVYSWMFTQFNWYNARKFSLDNEKFQEIINEYYSSISESIEDETLEVPQINVENFEWYLVITWKDKVTTVINNIDLVDSGASISANGFWWQDYLLNFYESWSEIVSLSAVKKWSNYDISLNASDLIIIDWVVTPKISTSGINVKFDVKVTVKSQYEDWENTIIPLKGTWTYKPISEFSVEAPEDAQDLSAMISSYLWWMLGSSDYDDGEYYDEYNDEDLDNEILDNEEVTEEVTEQIAE